MDRCNVVSFRAADDRLICYPSVRPNIRMKVQKWIGRDCSPLRVDRLDRLEATITAKEAMDNKKLYDWLILPMGVTKVFINLH